MSSCLKTTEKWVLSGSLCGWGDVFIPYFDLVVFLRIPKEIRMERLLERERNRYGSEIDKDGKLYQDHLTFMDWASKYDSGDIDIRSKKLHYEWLEKLNCQVLKIEEDIGLSEKILKVESLLE